MHQRLREGLNGCMKTPFYILKISDDLWRMAGKTYSLNLAKPF